MAELLQVDGKELGSAKVSAGPIGFQMTRADIERFLVEQKRRGLATSTLGRYRNALERLYQALPESKYIRAGALAQWREELLDSGLSPATVNVVVTAWDSFLDFVGHREYQVVDRLSPENKLQPELTRNEYLRLLQTAKLLEKERTYMLVKVLGSVDIRVQDLPLLTIEAVKAGRLVTAAGSRRQTARVPKPVQAELLAYAARNGILAGPVFVTKSGLPMNRTALAVSLKRLGEAARIPAGKATARALRKLCRQTRVNIESNLELLIEQAIDRQLEQEELTVGWGV